MSPSDSWAKVSKVETLFSGSLYTRR
jgi:hypothetical protein